MPFNLPFDQRQLAVIKGPAYNVIQSLKHADEGPLELTRRQKHLVWDDEVEVAPEPTPAEPEAAVNEASEAETVQTREHNQPFRFTFEHRWMAPSVCAANSTMFPTPSSPRPRFQPADFSRNSKFDVPMSPLTASTSGSSVRGSPDRRGDMRGELLDRSVVA